MDQAPARIDRSVFEQPFDRAPAERRNALIYLPDLLGRMDMDRAVRQRPAYGRESVRRYGAQRMRRDADARSGQICDDRACSLDQLQEALRIVDEALLSRCGRRAVEAALHVERRQESEADADCGARGGDMRGHLAYVRIGTAVGIVVEIME